MAIRSLVAGAVVVALVAAACQPSGAGSSRAPSSSEPAGTGSPPAAVEPEGLRVTTDGWATDFTKASVSFGDFLGGGPPKDGIPAIDSPGYESIADSRTWLAERSPVISLEIDGVARAYPLAVMMWHEIVNDTLADTPVVVTFCPLCNTGLVFERRLDGTTYDFGTTGNLRYSDLVMYDRQTESWWQQATGEAIVGELTGTALVFVPAQIVSIAAFAATYPDGDVLSRDSGYQRDYGRNPYVGYDRVGTNPFLFEGVVDGRLGPKERVVTIGTGAEAVAFPFSELRKVGVASGAVDGRSVVVFWAPGAASALGASDIDEGADIGASGVFRPVADGRVLTFERPGDEDSPIVDRETGSTWSITGLASAGPLAGLQLEAVAHGDHFWFAWAAFSPQTTIWTAP